MGIWDGPCPGLGRPWPSSAQPSPALPTTSQSKGLGQLSLELWGGFCCSGAIQNAKLCESRKAVEWVGVPDEAFLTGRAVYRCVPDWCIGGAVAFLTEAMHPSSVPDWLQIVFLTGEVCS